MYLTFSTHCTVKHSAKEYARREGDVVVHTNTIENVFSVFKRGMVGVYQHCGEAHLHRYLTEFDFRYNRRAALKVSDAERTEDCFAVPATSASPIGGLVKPVTLKQKSRKFIRLRNKRRLDSE